MTDPTNVAKVEVNLSSHKAYSARMDALFDQMATRMNSFQLEALRHQKCLATLREGADGVFSLHMTPLAAECEEAMKAVVQAITDACAIFNRHTCDTEARPQGH